ncbi:MAG TPA: hypothetical protein VEL03_19910, partial [Streptosporangiaceae bacterium]|nr:hypothetical protein [Streptosporangiaceae bacterium]
MPGNSAPEVGPEPGVDGQESARHDVRVPVSAAPHRLIAVDAMGGDYAPAEIVAGAVLAARQLSTHIV